MCRQNSPVTASPKVHRQDLERRKTIAQVRYQYPSDYRDGIDFDEKIGMRQSSHLHCRTCRRRCTEDTCPHIGVSEEQVDVGDVCRRLHQTVERRTDRCKALGNVCRDLFDLSAHVADADDLSRLVSRKLSRHVDRTPSGNGYNVRIKDVAIQSSNGKAFGLSAVK